MSLARREELQDLARRGAPEAHDHYSESGLDRALGEYLAQRREGLTQFSFAADGRPFPTVLHALLSDTPFDTIRFEFRTVPPEDRGWEYLRPMGSLTLAADGAAQVVPPGAAAAEPVRAMGRLLVREHFVPRSAAQDREAARAEASAHPRGDLFPPPEFARFVRRTGVVPMSAALLLYYPEERVRYELDLLDNALLPDPRQGRMRNVEYVRRSARLSHAVDRYVARGEVSLPNVRALEIVFETRGLSPIDLAPVFGGVRERATSSLETLAARRLVTLHRPTGQYRPNLEAILPTSDRGRARPEAAPLPPNPLLRTSVAELLAAAEARATCPLCGDPMPPGPRGLLCPKCTALVSAGGE